MEQLQNFIDPVSSFLWGWLLIYILLATGLYFSIRTRLVQFRRFGHLWRLVFSSRGGAQGGISSFQAFCIGLASRVGTGNIAGVAIALTLGGPGAIFWMWCVALLGMATAFVEASLAQVFKVALPDGTFRGGPFTEPTQLSGIVLALLAAPVFFGGVRAVARVAEWLLPAMALAYIALALVMLTLHLDHVPAAFLLIVRSAFGL